MFFAMSPIDSSPLWLGEKSPVKSKYEKCQDITTEIYKRINITFAIKNLESKDPVSDETNDQSDQIDSNELSNGTDLFAYEKTDSLSSSVTLDDFKSPPRKVINLNNNEETLKKPKQRSRRAKKRFRKRVKKKPAVKTPETDCSSDEEPLSRIVVDCKKRNDAKRAKTEKRTLKIPPSETTKDSAVGDYLDERSKSSSDRDDASKTNPVEVAVTEQMAKEYEYFSKVMEEVGEGPDLETVLMPALYPEVDLYERKLELPQHDVTYYTFADLVSAGPSTSQPLTPEFTRVHNRSPSTPRQRSGADPASENADGDLVRTSSENTETSFTKIPTGREDAILDLSLTSFSLKASTNLNLESSADLSVESKRVLESMADFDKDLDESAKELQPMNLSTPKGRKGARKSKVAGKRARTAPERKECEHCKLTFSGVRGLRRHLKGRCTALRETKEHPHAIEQRTEPQHRCQVCQKCFTRYDTWKRHQRVHSKATELATALTPQ